ncbi:hypothetical protein Agub_g1466 [Astrephomene gubernaculifera]|uniref:ARC6 IMS domain-containing protein n=1 Tax=Astrephomene gubernaculifera TaxID=47775 RepID=A0AAD3DI02_9CHLO|nr:hypothetical protein Agub_g1466 [Astrephomene gubernaculifera]
MQLKQCTSRTCAPSRPLSARPLHGAKLHQPKLLVARYSQGIPIDLDAPSVRLPLEGPELLGLRKNEVPKDSDLNSVYEQLVDAPVEAGYSETAVSGRLEVLDYVRRDLISSKGRAKESRELNLPTDLLPGAVALMTEVGQSQLALEVGSQMLRAAEEVPAAVRRDVLLSMALANCSLASESLQGGKMQAQQLERGCGYLEAALQLLEGAGEPPLAPGLAAEIRQGLASLRLQGALEQLSGPISQNKVEYRKRALRIVREALRGNTGAASSQQPQQSQHDSQFGPMGFGLAAGGSAVMSAETLESLLGSLTSEEVVHLLEWEQVVRNQATYVWVYPGLLEAVGVAHVVHGFVCRQPAYVKMALGLVQQLPSTPDLSVVEAVCQVLLGAVNQAAAALKQAERPGKASASDRLASSRAEAAPDAAGSPLLLPASRDAYQFVVAHSRGSDDGLLPGLCMLTERWLTQAAYPFFRDTASPDTPPASLVKYFDDTRVETLLTVYDAKSGGQLAETLSEALASIKRGLHKAASEGLLATSSTTQGGVGVATANPALAGRHRLIQTLAGGFMLAAAVAAGLMTPPGQRLLGRSEGAALVRAPVEPLMVAPEQFDTAVARQLLERWQGVKAAALGAAHSTAQLEVLLAEPLLGETLDKVATLRSHGAHMRFKLLRLEVRNVRRVSHKAGPAVRISALLEDSADLHNDADGKPVNACHRTYDADYTVVQGKDSVWRMTNTNVVEREGRK